MDVQRVILIAALAIISYMMVIKWNEDYGQQPVATEQTASVSAYGSASSSELPTEVSTASNDSDVPAQAQPVVAASGQLVKVSTDVLNVLIDTKGGDIIEVSLPQHKASLGSELPFVLLEQNQNRTYVAQSGLIGRDGADASKDGRPTYQVSASEFKLEGDTLNVDLVLKQGDINHY